MCAYCRLRRIRYGDVGNPGSGPERPEISIFESAQEFFVELRRILKHREQQPGKEQRKRKDNLA
jgi:hypothetical protein